MREIIPDEPELAAFANSELSERPTWVRYQVLLAACVLAVITYLHRVGFATVAAELKTPLGLSADDISWLMAAFMVAYGVFEMPWGYLGDKLGVRHIVAAVILGGSLLTACVPLVLLLPANVVVLVGFLVVIRFLFGLFQAGTFPAISRMMADWLPTTERGSAQGAVWMSSRLGGFIAPVVIVQLISVMGGWTVPWLLLACLGLVWCVLFWPWFRNRPREMATVNPAERKLIEAGQAGRAVHGHGEVPWGAMCRSISVWSLFLMYGFLGFSGNFYLTLLPTYLKHHRHFESELSSWLTSLPFGFGVLACLAGGAISDAIIRRWGKQWGRRLVGIAGLSLAGSAILAVPWVESTWMLGFLLVLAFFGNDLAMAPAWASAADIGERYTGVLSGGMNMMASFMAAIEARWLGHLLGKDNLVLPFILLACSYALGTIAWFGVDVRKPLSAAS
jgi:sugar phosphate permease